MQEALRQRTIPTAPPRPRPNFYRPPGFDPSAPLADQYFASLTKEALHWLCHVRGLSEEVVWHNKIFCEARAPRQPPERETARGDRGCPEEMVLCFPTFRDGQLVNVKYRHFQPYDPEPFATKKFTMVCVGAKLQSQRPPAPASPFAPPASRAAARLPLPP
jgi:hypothetical protein